jgi:hypothetical protein
MAEGGAAAAKKTGSGPDPLVGRIFNERYKVLALIARGGMGKVYRAEQSPLGRVVALKVLNPTYSGDHDPEFHKRFFLEASMTAKLRHPNTVMVFDYGRTEDNIYYMAMEYLEGHTLHRAIRQAGHFSEERTAHVARQICRSLREAHSVGVVHRDLKPANIYLLEHGDEPDFVKVLDFGLVKNVADKDGEELTKAGLFMGSPKYMAPEQIQGGTVDARTDVYALGVIMYEMIAGKVPFDQANNMQLLMAHVNDEPPPIRKTNPAAKLSTSMEETIARAMSKSPQDRFRSMDEVLAALKRLGPSPAPEPSGALTADPERFLSTGSGPQVSRVVEAPAAAAAPPFWAPAAAEAPQSDAAAAPAPRKQPAPLLIAGVVAALALAGGIGYLTLRSPSVDRTAPTPAAAAATQTAAVAAAASAPPPAALPSAPATVTEVDFAALAPASAAQKAPPAVPSPAPARPKAGAQAPGPAAPAAARPPAPAAAPKGGANCNPSFFYDADGNKHFKPECFAQ